MSEYDIERWDVVMFNNSNAKSPMIYIKPDLTFLQFARANNYAVVCEISGTGTIYDGKEIPGVVNTSMYVPNCRPNFYNETGWYVVTLSANWYGYPEPSKLGRVKFYGMKDWPEDKNIVEHESGANHGPKEQKLSAENTEGSEDPDGKFPYILIGSGVALMILTMFVAIRIARKK